MVFWPDYYLCGRGIHDTHPKRQIVKQDVLQVRHESIAKWLQPRAAAVRSLRLRASGESDAAAGAEENLPCPVSVIELPCIHDFGR